MHSRMVNFWPLTREPIKSCTATRCTKHQFVSSSAIKACETIAGTTESHRRIAIYYGGAQLSYIGERTNEGTFLPRPWSCSTRESYCSSEQSQGESQSALRNWSSGRRRSHQGTVPDMMNGSGVVKLFSSLPNNLLMNRTFLCCLSWLGASRSRSQ